MTAIDPGRSVPGALRQLLADPGDFSRVLLPRYRLRGYQLGAARAIADAVARGGGQQFAVVFSRQAGKDELLAQLVAFLLTRYQRRGGTIVLGAPTQQPQAIISRDRALDRLRQSALTVGRVGVREGYIVQVGQATARYMSAAPGANARGQTADLLLVANEAQDIQPAVWDAVFDPMAASTNATTVFMGTVWDANGLLARQLRHLTELEARDGVRRVYRVPWDVVAQELPAYGERVRARIDQLGEQHPFIRTEYCLEELDSEGGLFPPGRLAQLQGEHQRRVRAEPGQRYALLVDVAGEEEGGTGPQAFADGGKRDSTALTVVEVDLTGGVRGLPRYQVVDRRAWTGVRHTSLHAQLVDLARTVWRASAVVVDATGIGAGLASFLADALKGRSSPEPGEVRRGYPRCEVVPFVFTSSSKSKLGWDFVSLIDAGRVKEYQRDGDELMRLYWAQLGMVTYEVLAGPGRLLRWSVPTSRGHDDLVLSAALVAVLDGLDWRPRVAVGATP